MFRRRMIMTVFLFFLPLMFISSHARASDVRWNKLKERLVVDGLNSEYVDTVFSAASLKFDSTVMSRKIVALLERKQTPPAIRKEKDDGYDERYVGPVLLAGAYSFLRENYPILQDVDSKYGVKPTVLVALLLVETRLGFTLGDNPALNNLANMAATDSPDLFIDQLSGYKISTEESGWLKDRTKKKSEWAYKELLALLKFSIDNSMNPIDIPGSPYGAFGICQFMPTTALSYAVDGDGDGRIDLFKRPDALYSMANFLKRHGWENSLPRDKKMKVIYHYNHSTYYARTILEVAAQLKSIQATFGPK